MSIPVVTTTVIDTLSDTVSGEVITPDSADYDAARQVCSGTADLRPAVVVRAASAADVQAVVNAARESGAELAVRAGGHSAAGHGTTEGGIALDLRGLDDITIDPDARVARVGAGLTAGEFVAAAGEHGLTTGFGDTGSVGIAGITLGAGVGLLSRKLGLTIDSLLGADVVTADGELLSVDAEHHPDLFWAIRGGGGNFGVVTQFTFRLHPVDEVYGGLLALPATPAVLAGFLAESAKAPAELTTIVTVLPCPPLPFVPKEVHGTVVLLTQLVYAGDVASGEQAVAPFRALATPLADLAKAQPYTAMFPAEEQPRVTAVTRTMFLDHLDEAGATTLLDGVGACPAPMFVFQLRVLGGAVAEVPADATAYAHRDKRIVTYLGAFYRGEDNGASTRVWADRITADLDQGDRSAYVCFVGEPGQVEARDCYPDATWQRLSQIKDRYDPTNVFRRNHNVPPTTTE